MSTKIYVHNDCLAHDPGSTHPENPGRLHAILATLKNSKKAANYSFAEAPLGTEAQILLAHTPGHLHLVKGRSPKLGRYSLDADTIMSPGSLTAALRGVGAACAGVDDLMTGSATSVFCLTRPPGHHATSDRAMGFCLFNNIAIAALYAMQAHKVERIAIVDFDVHHGNGTQDIMRGRAGIHYLSTHQSHHYPGTGTKMENLSGNISNFPLHAGMTDQGFQEVFGSEVLPALDQGKPELILVSAGFDAHAKDPLASIELTEASYYWLGQQLQATADKYCGGKMLSVLEGGYNLDALGLSVDAYLAGISSGDEEIKR
jgi:acetoin utilization deacetylase AcuC-like enzyme